jgi:hypothetical protein
VSFSFDPGQGLILVRAEIWGPDGSGVLRLALDTGATGTLVNVAMLVAIGYDPGLVSDRIQVTTGSGIEFVCLMSLWIGLAPWGRNAAPFPFWPTPCRQVRAWMACWASTSFSGRA